MKRVSHLLWAVLVSCVLASPAWAATYTFRSDIYAWETTTTALAWDRTCTGFQGDDDQTTITFTGGFTFNFAGTAYGSVRVLSNGILQFGADTGLLRTYTNTALPAAAAASYGGGCAAAATARAMMIYWADLNPTASGSGSVTWQQKGTAPNRYVVVSWNSVYQYNTTTPYTFQVILYENGEFKYQYGNANATGANATIGVQVSNADYTMYAFNSGYNANGTAIRWFVPSGAVTRVAEYRFDEYTYSGRVGEVTDSSGNGRNGVRVGAAASGASGYVCRRLDVPANTSSTSSGADTLLDLGSAVGATGSIGFWFRSNALWTSAPAAMLLDATRSSSRPFFLMLDSGGRLRFTLADSAGASVTATTPVQSFAALTWVYLTATWRLASGTNQSTLRIYINGVLAATASGTTNGTLDPSLGTLLVGDNRSTSTPSGATVNSANGSFDELRVDNFEATTLDIAAGMLATRACAPPLDHYELSLASSSVACTGTTVTVKACADSSSPCTNPSSNLSGQTATLATSAGTLDATTLVFDATGIATTTLRHPGAAAGANVTVTLSGEQTAAQRPRHCCPDGVACAAANSCATTFATAGFIVAATANGAAATLPAQTAGTASSGWVLRAVRSNTTTRACEAALIGTTTVDWAAQCHDPGTCSAGNLMSVTGSATTAVASNPASGVTTTTPVAMSFDANGNAPFSFSYADAGQVSLRASKTVNGASLVGSTNRFVVRPAGFTISSIRQTASPGIANPGASGTGGATFVRAGEAFSATVTAVTASGTPTPNFGREAAPEGVVLAPTLVAPSSGTPGTLANATIAGTSFGAGAATATNLSYSEVGIATLAASIADGSYLGAGNVSGAASGNIGRFVPARLALSAASVTHRAAAACSPASSFTYLGENFSLRFALEAQNAAGATTRNYTGGFAKFDPTVASAYALVGRDGATVFDTAGMRLSLATATGAWSNGVASAITLTASAARAASPDGPFGAAFGIAPVDSDGVALAGFDMASTAGGTNDRATVASVPLRYGRLRLSNAVGVPQRALSLPVAVQVWNGSAFDVHTLDSCTRVNATGFSVGNLRRTLAAADVNLASSSIAFTAGVGRVDLSAPAAGRYGSADVALSLGGAAVDSSCLQTWTPARAATAGANLAFLRGAWCGSADKDPSARATWGVYGGSDDKLYSREDF
jgi:MSHA biogenesis protein MshQ